MTATTTAAPVIEDVVSQHAENASFLWLLRDRAVCSPKYRLAELIHLDRRIEANLHGLQVAGEGGWQLARESLSTGDPGDCFMVTVAALKQPPEIQDEVIAACKSIDVPGMRGLVSGLAWTGSAQARQWLERLSQSARPAARHLAVAVRACGRSFEEDTLVRGLADEAAVVRARALKAVGECGRIDLEGWVQRELADEDAGCRYWAAWSATLLGMRGAEDLLVGQTLESKPATNPLLTRRHEERAVDLAVRAAGRGAGARRLAQLQGQGRIRMALIAARALGEPATVAWVLELLAVKEHARLAGDVICNLTGLDLAHGELLGEPPGDGGGDAGPTDDPEDANVALDADQDLPWPDVAGVKRWWHANRLRFHAGTRYLQGNPVEPGSLKKTLVEGSQQQRHFAALELALASPDAPLLEVRAPGFRQG